MKRLLLAALLLVTGCDDMSNRDNGDSGPSEPVTYEGSLLIGSCFYVGSIAFSTPRSCTFDFFMATCMPLGINGECSTDSTDALGSSGTLTGTAETGGTISYEFTRTADVLTLKRSDWKSATELKRRTED